MKEDIGERGSEAGGRQVNSAVPGAAADLPTQLPTPDPAPAPRTKGTSYAEIVQGEGLILRRLRPEDVTDRYVGWMNDPDVIRYLQARFEERDLESLRRHVAGFDHINDFFFGIFDAATCNYIGNISMRVNRHHLFAHMGYLIGEKQYWAGDTARQACYALFDFAFFERGVRKILECTTENHTASNFNFRRMGFVYEGKIPDLYWGEGRYHAATYWSIKATDWAQRRSRSLDDVTP